MEIMISTQGGHDSDAVDVSMESTPHHSIRLRRRRNFLTSPLLRIPTELILDIFAHVIDTESNDDGPLMLVLTAICHQLREIGVTSPQLWSTVDLTTPPIAELFLERCEYDPHALIWSQFTSERRSPYFTANPEREVLWEKLEGCTLNNLRSLVFERGDSKHEFTRRIFGVLRRAPNISNLDLDNARCPRNKKFLWPPGSPIPNLSTLRLRHFSISWTSPVLRNLSQLTLDLASDVDFNPFNERTSTGTFITALVNCPDLEILNLTHAGPDLLNSQDNHDVVVQLCKLRELSLEFWAPSRTGYILSHIKYPESAEVAVHVPFYKDTDFSETISQILPHQNVGTVQYFHKSTELNVLFDSGCTFSMGNCFVRFRNEIPLSRIDPQALPRFASKIVEVAGRGTITSLDVGTRFTDPPDGMWEAFLHGLPLLERIRYNLTGGDVDFVDSFVLVFSRPFEGGPVCPQLQHLELPGRVLTQDSSAAVLKSTLAERNVCGRRLKRIGFCGYTEVDDRPVLEPFLDLVDEAW